MKEDMMKMDLGMFFDYFRSDEVLTSLSFEQMIKHYNDYKITNKKLKELKEDYYVSQVEAKLNNPNTEWEDDQNEYVINYKKELEYHLKMVKEPMDNLLKKIEKIDKEYDIKLEKYDKQFDIVSKLKIEIDAKNEVKTGYENILKNLGDNNIEYLSEWSSRKEARIKDKYMKVRIRYEGSELAIIQYILTFYT